MAARHVPNFLTPRGKLVRPVNHPVVPTAEAQSPSEVSILRSSGCSLLQWEVSASEGIGSKGTDVSVDLTPLHCRCPKLMGLGYRVAPALAALEVVRVPRAVSGMPS